MFCAVQETRFAKEGAVECGGCVVICAGAQNGDLGTALIDEKARLESSLTTSLCLQEQSP
eukprot:1171288-Prorocentrum_lima.AAC.1